MTANEDAITSLDWQRYFPFQEIRKEQDQAISFVLNEFVKSGKQFAVCEVGTGGGKSAIGLTIAKYLTAHDPPPVDLWDNGAFFLTTQKILQDQYINDFGSSDNMCSIKSSTNYQCKHYKKQSCSESMQMLRTADKSSKFFKTCTMSCHYKADKKKYSESTLGLTNFSYFMTDNAFNAKVKPRNLLVVDEAHNIETEISKFVEITVSERFSSQFLDLAWPSVNTHHQAVTWIKDTYFPKCRAKIDHVDKTLEKYKGLEQKIKEIGNLAKELDLLKSHAQKIEKFLEIQDSDNWVFEEIAAFGQKMRSFSFKPIDISQYAKDNLFRMGRRVLMLSATILNKEAFCGSLGLDPDSVAFISIPTPFPVENRPVLYFPVGNMGADHIDETLPKMLKMVKKILEEHPKEKGIIHCVDSNSMISMSDGTQKPLIEILPGDEIITWNEVEEKFENSRVIENWDKGVQECIDIHMEDGSFLSCTPEHRILTRNRGWVEAKDLTTDDDVVTHEEQV